MNVLRVIAVLVAFVASWIAGPAAEAALVVRLVEDIYPGTNPSTADHRVPIGNQVFFSADRAAYGTELWLMGGSSPGARLIKDINPGPNPSFPGGIGVDPVGAEIDGRYVFVAKTDDRGYELFRSDGTRDGTGLVKEIRPGPGTGVGPGGMGSGDMEVLGGIALFVGSAPASGFELWRTDGTAAGTRLVKDIRPGVDGSTPGGFVRVGRFVYFNAFRPGTGYELWRTDGTADGTRLIKDIDPGPDSSSPFGFAGLNGLVLFSASHRVGDRELWRTDGTAAGTVRVRDIDPGSAQGGNPDWLTRVGDRLVFSATRDGFGYEIWRTDGTPGGTGLVKDINPAGGNSLPAQFLTDGRSALFQANDGTHGVELWRTDGTRANTVMVKDINPLAPGSTPNDLTRVDGLVFFAATANGDRELWRTDGSRAGTGRAADINPGGGGDSFPFDLVAAGRSLFFSADDGTHGFEPWKAVNR